jgi:hypothetical protein
MGLFDRAGDGERLLRLLRQERDAVLAGDYKALGRLTADKERLLGRLAAGDTDGNLLSLLRQAARANHALLDAATRGFREVMQQFPPRLQQDPQMLTYDVRGQRQDVLRPSAKLERRV